MHMTVQFCLNNALYGDIICDHKNPILSHVYHVEITNCRRQYI